MTAHNRDAQNREMQSWGRGFMSAWDIRVPPPVLNAWKGEAAQSSENQTNLGGGNEAFQYNLIYPPLLRHPMAPAEPDSEGDSDPHF